MEIDNVIEKVCSTYTQDKYAMYLRKSRADMELEALGEGETLAKHKTMLFALAAKHDIHPDQITIYQEIVSGESIQDRPECQKLLDDVYAKKYKGVLVAEIERLARGNTKDQGEVADAFQFSDTKIITPAKVYDPHDEFDQEYFEFGLFMSRREYKTIRRRLVAGKEQAVLDGNYLLPQRIFGYNIEKKAKNDRYLVPNPEEEKYVHMMFDWFTEEGKTAGWIARQFTLMGLSTPKGSKEWSKATIKEMLRNKHYIGMLQWGMFKTVKTKDPATGTIVKRRVKVDPAEIKEIKGKHKALISDEQFQKAQERFSVQLPQNIDCTLSNPFAGLLFCASCGRSMYWFNPKKQRTIRLAHRESAICKKKSLPADSVIDAIVDALKAYIADFEIKMAGDNNQSERIRYSAMIDSMEAELAKQERKRRKLFDDYEDEVYTKEEFIERKQVYASTIDNLKKQLKEAKEHTPEPIDYAQKIVALHQVIDCIRNPELDAQAKNDFLKQYIDRITYDAIDYGRNKGGKAVIDVYLK